MSTEFTTIPKIKYQDVLDHPKFKAEDYNKKVFIYPHKLLRAEGLAGSIWIMEEPDSFATFTRFGNQNTEILIVVAQEFKVEVVDQYGLRFCNAEGVRIDESGG